MAQGAIQGGKYAAKAVKAELKGANPAEREPFQYFDKGSMATVSRFSAVAKIGPLEFGGFIAWLAWLVLHHQNCRQCAHANNLSVQCTSFCYRARSLAGARTGVPACLEAYRRGTGVRTRSQWKSHLTSQQVGLRKRIALGHEWTSCFCESLSASEMRIRVCLRQQRQTGVHLHHGRRRTVWLALVRGGIEA
jgi:hypothetical protein